MLAFTECNCDCRRKTLELLLLRPFYVLFRWQVKDDGHRDPNLRVLVKPLLNLFHGDRGNKRWKNLIDAELKARKHKTLTELMDATLKVIPDDVLDAPPKSARAVAVALQDGREELPVWGLADVLPGAEDRAGGAESKRFRRSESDGGLGTPAAAAAAVIAMGGAAGGTASAQAVAGSVVQGGAGAEGQQRQQQGEVHQQEQQQQQQEEEQQKQMDEEPELASVGR
jgi:hypothetical protein